MTPDADISKGTLEQELLCFDSGPQVGTRVHTLAGSIWKILKGPEDTPKGGYLQWQERGREKAHRGGAEVQLAEGYHLSQSQIWLI